MCPLHEVKGEVKDSGRMTHRLSLSGEGAGSRSWEERKTTSALRLAVVKGEGFPTGCISGPLNNLVLWEERQGRGELASAEGTPLILDRRNHHSGVFIALGDTKDGRGLSTVYIFIKLT